MSISKFLEEARLWMLTGGHAAQHAGMGVSLVPAPQLISTRCNSMANGTRDGGTVADSGRLIRVSHVCTTNTNMVQLAYTNVYNGTSGETPNTNPVLLQSVIEYPLGTVYQVTFGGKKTAVIDGGATLLSDWIAVPIPQGATFYERTLATVALPPTVSSAAGSGGSLAAATYYAKITSVTAIGESGGSVETSTAVSASGTLTHTITDSNVLTPTLYYNYYRSATSGAEVLVCSIPAGTKTFTDTGAITPGSATVPSSMLVPRGIQLSASIANEGQTFNSSPTALVAASPGLSAVSSNCFSACAIYGIATGAKASVGCAGDSIMSGTGDTGYNGRTYGDAGFAVRALDAALIPHISASQGGETLAKFQGVTRKNRLARLVGCKHVLVNYMTNSLATQTVAQMQAAVLEITAALNSIGAKVWWATCNPKTPNSTDNWTTAAGQTPITTPDGVDATYNSVEARRLAMNAWLRDTSAAGYISQAGGAAKAAVFDSAATVEVNASNIASLTGGRYICAPGQSTAYYGTIDGTHPSTAAHILMSAAVPVGSLV